ncbi:hypothetical protein HGRIS_000007 [Hohenbuehelia grisea]|uniref:Uncharacterized protein n=1 Tax=Hohenbuehelia grisea TaxID=104357 RepID=A0ABR3JRL4_9AGAR
MGLVPSALEQENDLPTDLYMRLNGSSLQSSESPTRGLLSWRYASLLVRQRTRLHARDFVLKGSRFSFAATYQSRSSVTSVSLLGSISRRPASPSTTSAVAAQACTGHQSVKLPTPAPSAAGIRNCPVFCQKREGLHDRLSHTRFKLFPTRDPSTWLTSSDAARREPAALTGAVQGRQGQGRLAGGTPGQGGGQWRPPHAADDGWQKVDRRRRRNGWGLDGMRQQTLGETQSNWEQGLPNWGDEDHPGLHATLFPPSQTAPPREPSADTAARSPNSSQAHV